MECEETTKKDEEEEDNKSKDAKTEAPINVSAAGNTFGELGSDESTDKSAHGGDGKRVQVVGQEEQKSLKDSHPIKVSVTLSKEDEDFKGDTESTHEKINEQTNTLSENPNEKQITQTKQNVVQPLVSISDTSTTETTHTVKPEVTIVEESNLSEEPPKCDIIVTPSVVSIEEQDITEVNPESDEACSEVTQNLEHADKTPVKPNSFTEIDNTSPKYKSPQIEDGLASAPHQEQVTKLVSSEKGESTEGKEILQLEPEQSQTPKQTESAAKKTQAKTASGAIAKRRASETPAFKYAQLGQSMPKTTTTSSKPRDMKARNQLSPGKAVSTSTGIKGSRSAEELQRAEILQPAGTRRKRRDSALETKIYSPNKASFREVVSPRRKSETPMRLKSEDKSKKEETDYSSKPKMASNDKKDVQDQRHSEKGVNIDDEVKPILPEETSATGQNISENKTSGKKEAKILEEEGNGIAEKGEDKSLCIEENEVTNKEENYSDSKEIKTQQNMKVVNADLASTNKSSEDMRMAETNLASNRLPEDQQEEEGKKSIKMSPENFVEKQVFLDKDLKQSEETFAQKQIDEMLCNQHNTISRHDVSHDKALNKDSITKIANESNILGNQQVPKEQSTEDSLLKDSNKETDNVDHLQKISEQSGVDKYVNKLETVKYTEGDNIVSKNIKETQKPIQVKDNKISSTAIQTQKTDKNVTSKLVGEDKGERGNTTNSSFKKKMSNSVSQNDDSSQTGVVSQGRSVENGSRSRTVPKTCNTELTNEIPKHDTAKTTSTSGANNKQNGVDFFARDTSGKFEKKEKTSKRDKPKQTDSDSSSKPKKANGVSCDSFAQTQTPGGENVAMEVEAADIRGKPVLHTHEELDQFISNQIQAELISKWVMNGESSTPTSPHDLSPQPFPDVSDGRATDLGGAARKTFQGQSAEPKVVREQLQRNQPSDPVSTAQKVPEAKQAIKSKVVPIVHSLAARVGGHSRLAPIQDEEEGREYNTLDSQARVQLDGLEDEAGRGCGGMKSTSCRLYFGVKNYLNQFYDPNSVDNTQGQGYYYTEDDDFEYLVDPNKEQRRQRCCRGFWFRAGIWGGVNLLLVGVIALLVGYLTPPRDMVVGYQDNLEILDRWAIAFNHRLELCRLAGLTVFCCGGLVLLVTLLMSSFLPGRRRRHCCDHSSAAEPCVLGDPHAAGKIPVTEHIKSVQPSPWPDLGAAKETDHLAVQMP